MNNIDIIRREISRALASRRPAYRGKLTRWKFKAKGANLVQLEALAGEALQNVECMQQAGFVSGLPAGTQVIALPLGGKTVHTIIIATEFGQYKVQVGEGEVALHHLTESGTHVWLKSGGVVEVKCATKVRLEAPLIELAADLVHATGALTVDGLLTGSGGMAISGGSGAAVNGNLDTTGTITNNGTNVGSTHSHADPQGGTVGPPI